MNSQIVGMRSGRSEDDYALSPGGIVIDFVECRYFHFANGGAAETQQLGLFVIEPDNQTPACCNGCMPGFIQQGFEVPEIA